MSGSHPVVLAAPGKHAFAPSIARFQEHHAGMGIVCGPVNSVKAVAHLATLGIEAIAVPDPRLFAFWVIDA